MTEFQRQVQLVMSSGDHELMRHQYLGQRLKGGGPLYLAPQHHSRHGVIYGTPGTGKTSYIDRAVYLTCMQNRAFRNLPKLQTSVVVFDHKGSEMLLKSVARTAKAFGMPMKVFSILPEMWSHLFLFLKQSNMENLSPVYLAQQLVTALNCYYGNGYGPGAFGAFNILAALCAFSGRETLTTIREFARLIRDPRLYVKSTPGEAEDLKHAQHLVCEAMIAGEVHAMNATLGMPGITQEVIDAAIDMPSLLSGPPQLYYFFLPAMELPQLSGTCGRLPIYPLLRAAARRKPNQTNSILIAHDEFHIAAAPPIVTPIEQARERKCAWMFCYQYPSQLSEFRTKLDEAIQGCASYFIAFDAPNFDARRELLAQMGTRNVLVPSYSASGLPRERPRSEEDIEGLIESQSYSLQERPYFDENEMLQMTKDPSVAFFWAKTTEGLTRDFRMVPFRWSHYRTQGERDQLEDEPLPRLPGQFEVQYDPFPRMQKKKRQSPKHNEDEEDET
jgi:hypothetical protein